MWLATLALVSIAPLSSGELYDAIVVGLGPAGVSALSRLAEKGHKVVGLEAKSRLGGRVSTQEFGGGIVELGAEWIHGEVGNPTYALARENNVAILDYKWRTRCANTAGYNESLVNGLFEYCFNITDEAGPEVEHETLGSYIEMRFYEHIANTSIASNRDFCENFLRSVEIALATAEAFDSWQDVTVRSSRDYHECPGSQGWSWNKIGYRTLFDILLHKYNNGTGLPASIELDSEVTSIDTSNIDNVTVTTVAGEKYVAKAAIVTVSLGVLKHSHSTLFVPSLPEDKKRSIDALSIGTVDKICLHYDTPWWGDSNNYYFFFWKDEDRKNISSEDWWVTQLSGFSVSLSNANVITLWITGAGARSMERLGEDTVRQKVEATLALFFKDVPRASDMTRTRWYSDKHTRGSYSYRGGAAGSAAILLSRPIGRLHFAGEATSEHHFSTVHGALETGWREADNVHRLLSTQRRK